MNILLIAPTWVGDSIFILPAVKAVRRSYTGCRVTLFARPGICELHAANPLFDECISRTPGGRLERFRQQWSFRGRSFDLALVFPDSFSSALGAWMSGAGQRVGRAGEGRGLFLTDRLPTADRTRHVSDEYFDLATHVGAEVHPSDRQIDLPLTQPGVEEINRVFREAGVDPSGPVIGLCPTNAFGPAKAWPPTHWASLASRLKEQRYQPVVFGAPSESAQLREVQGLAGGQLPVLMPGLAGLAAGLARMKAVVANDSGPLHIAAAVGVRSLGLFGPVDPRWSSPFE